MRVWTEKASKGWLSIRYDLSVVLMDGWVRVLRPFNSISVISRRWKGEHERLCAMKCRLGSGRISPPAGFEPLTPWSEVGSANRSATRTLLCSIEMVVPLSKKSMIPRKQNKSGWQPVSLRNRWSLSKIDYGFKTWNSSDDNKFLRAYSGLDQPSKSTFRSRYAHSPFGSAPLPILSS